MTERLPESTLRLGLPSGSMQASTVELFGRAGYKVSVESRSVYPRIDDEQISAVLFRAQEISRYVVAGHVDCGLTGFDWIVENGNDRDVVEVAELTYSRATSNPAKWVLAVPDESPIRTPADFGGKVVATELVNVTRRYFAQRNVPDVDVEFSWGTTEIKARLVDGIVDLTETGSSIRANHLRVIDTLLSSTIRFVAGRAAWDVPWKREKMQDMAVLLRGAIDARAKVGLKMNASPEATPRIREVLAGVGMASPTVSQLEQPGWVAYEVILEERLERDLIPRLRRAGATGIISYPLNKVID